MSKKMMLLALTAISAALVALPAMASAAVSVDPAGVSFEGKTTNTAVLTATGEPSITCEGPNHVTGEFYPGSTTTGTISLDFTACHINVLGFTIACNNTGSGNTIKTAGEFHTESTGTTTVINVTPEETKVRCGGTTPIIVRGSVKGVITSPACGVPSNTATLEFNKAGGLTAETEGSGNKVAATQTAEATLTFAESVTKTC